MALSLRNEGDPLTYDEITIIHFTLGNKTETALVPKSAKSEEIKELFRNAAEAGPYDIVKLYTPNGHLLNISCGIPANDGTGPYRLVVVGLHCNGILVEEIGMDLLMLDKRVSELESRLKGPGSSAESIGELKSTLNTLRNKLEEMEHLSWLGFYKGLHPLPLPKESSRQTAMYHSRSEELKKVVCNKFLKISDVILKEETLSPMTESTFDNWQWEDEELLLLIQTMFMELDLLAKFQIEISVLRNFLMEVYCHYNDVPFHNFRHSFCVTQMMYGMVSKVRLSERVGALESLILLTSCICHDLDHPGYNNIYQINAQTELALRYNDISPLENHHCSIAFRILQDPNSNIFRNMEEETFKTVREGIIRCILATDMSRHNEILHQFREVVPFFEPANKTHVNLLSMVLIKVADISNEARPMNVAEPWLDCLLTEFFQQSDTEKLEGLPVTPFMDRDKITKPSSQCSFIGLVLLPLFEALAALFTELEPVIIAPVRYALDYYRRLNEASLLLKRRNTDAQSHAHRGSTVSSSQLNSFCDHNPSEGAQGRRTRDNSLSTSTDPSRPTSVHRGSSATSLPPPRTSIPRLTSFPSTESPDVDPDSEPEEAVTEVSVSERALKFKIATESSMELTCMSRKGSRGNESSDQSAHAALPMDEHLGCLNQESHKSLPLDSQREAHIKVKGKESFFRRFRLFTEKLGSPRSEKEPWAGSESSEAQNLVPMSPRMMNLSYFRRPQSEKPATRSKAGSPSGLRARRRSSRSRESAESEGGGETSWSSGKRGEAICSGSLDSILSKEEQGKSPMRRLMLPRLSSFVQKKTSKMGLLMKRSPKRMASPDKEPEERS